MKSCFQRSSTLNLWSTVALTLKTLSSILNVALNSLYQTYCTYISEMHLQSHVPAMLLFNAWIWNYAEFKDSSTPVVWCLQLHIKLNIVPPRGLPFVFSHHQKLLTIPHFIQLQEPSTCHLSSLERYIVLHSHSLVVLFQHHQYIHVSIQTLLQNDYSYHDSQDRGISSSFYFRYISGTPYIHYYIIQTNPLCLCQCWSNSN